MSPSAKNYKQLRKLDWTPNWVFRKYSSAKRKEFVFSTGFPAEEKYAAQAYKKGVAAFDEWLGQFVPSGRQLLIKDLARALLASKENKKGGKAGATYNSVRNQVNAHIIPHFGHLRPDQVTALAWDQYDQAERKRVYHRKGRGGVLKPYSRTTTKHTRAILMEILKRAHEERQIQQIPNLRGHDRPPAPPRYISKADVLKILRKIDRRGRGTKLLAVIMWKQGPRPAEVLQYRWEMIDWEAGPAGSIRIPGAITKTGRSRTIPLNSKVARILRWLHPRSGSPFIFPSSGDPDTHQKGYHSAWDSACARVGLDYQPYNLRDTFITNCLKRGLSSTFIAKYVDNSPAMIDQKYAVSDQESLGRVAE